MIGKLGASRRYTTFLVVVAAFGVIYTYAYLVSNIAPLMSGVFLDEGGLSAETAGWLISAYLGAMAVAAFSATSFVAKFSPYLLGLSGIFIASAGTLLAIVAPGPGGLAVSMTVAGFGNGALFAAANASAAHERYPVLLYGFGVVASCSSAAAVPPLLLWLVDNWSLAGLFIIPLGLAPLVLLSLGVFPRVASVATTHGEQRRAAPVATIPGALPLLGAILLLNLVQMAFFTFEDALLSDVGFGEGEKANIFSNTYLFAAVGGLMACGLARLPQHLLGLALILGLLLIGSIVSPIVVGSPQITTLSLYSNAVLSMLLIPVQLAVAAHIDPTGRIAAAASGALFTSWTIGPAAGGWTLVHFGFGGIAVMAVIAGSIALAALLLVHLAARRAYRSGTV